jgi:DNA-binding LytR/AlgR family response regulator
MVIKVKNKFNILLKYLNEKVSLLLAISIGVFLFILFFEPFPVVKFSFNDRLVFFAGFSAIILLVVFVVGAFFSLFSANKDIQDSPVYFSTGLIGFIIFLTGTIAFTFYLRYVGGVGISFYMMVKIILLCFVPPVILKLHDTYTKLKKQNELLLQERNIYEGKIEKFEEELLNKTIEFYSDTNSESLKFMIAEIAFVKSADNYVEIVFKEGETLKKRLLRNTLKNIELQLKQYTSFIRCHRICIVNKHYIEKLNKSFSNYSLSIKGFPDLIPVSRQYLFKLRESV